jgi:hypothetical protein
MPSFWRMVVCAACAALCSCKPAASPSPSIEGTTWAFCDGDTRVAFLPGGAVSMRGSHVPASSEGVAAGLQPTRCAGRWAQSGNDVTFDCNLVTTYEAEIEREGMIGTWERLPLEASKRPIGSGHGAYSQLAPTQACSDGTCASFMSPSSSIKGKTCLKLLPARPAAGG